MVYIYRKHEICYSLHSIAQHIYHTNKTKENRRNSCFLLYFSLIRAVYRHTGLVVVQFHIRNGQNCCEWFYSSFFFSCCRSGLLAWKIELLAFRIDHDICTLQHFQHFYYLSARCQCQRNAFEFQSQNFVFTHHFQSEEVCAIFWYL